METDEDLGALKYLYRVVPFALDDFVVGVLNVLNPQKFALNSGLTHIDCFADVEAAKFAYDVFVAHPKLIRIVIGIERVEHQLNRVEAMVKDRLLEVGQDLFSPLV